MTITPVTPAAPATEVLRFRPATSRGPAPKPHQVVALRAIGKAAAGSDRLQVRMACGTGKTLLARWRAEAAAATGVTLVLCPSLALLAQLLREWRSAPGWPFEALVVCSDPTTSAGAAERRGHDGADGQVDAPAWASARAKVTTSPGQVSRFLASKVPGRPQVVFSTYHSAPVVAAAQAFAGGDFDLVVCDEAHHLAGRPRPEFRAVQEKITAASWLFMTATAVILTGREDLISMDDPELFGPVAHTLGFGEAIDAGLLADYQVLVMAKEPGPHDGSSVRTYATDELPALVLSAIGKNRLQSLITYHGRNAKAAAFAKAMDGATAPDGRIIRARHINGTTPAGQRTQTLTWLGSGAPGEVRIVTNARCLVEGVDVPGVDGIVIADPRTSTVDIIQAVGRALRPAPGKRRGTIVLPVALPADSDDDSELFSSRFGHVWKALRAMRAHDQRLATELDYAARGLHAPTRGGRYGLRTPPRIVFDLPDHIDMDEVRLRLVSETGSKSAFYLGMLEAWAAANGNRMIPWNAVWEGGRKLGHWAEMQRRIHQRGLMPPELVAQLEQVPGWAWDREYGLWRDSHTKLAALADGRGTLHQDAAGPSIYAGLKDAAHLPLGHWAALQRQLQRDDMLADERAQQLESLPGWRWDGCLPDDDVAMIQALREYGEFNKHVDVPEDHLEGALPLGRWVLAVRRRKLTGRLHPALAEEIAAATPRGDHGEPTFEWKVADTRWRLAYSALRQYTRREGAATPTGSHREELPDTTVGLGQWASLQRFKHRRGELEPTYVTWLEGLPGWRWEIPLTTVEAAEPIDLDGHRHGTAKGSAAGCCCKPCLNYRRGRDRAHLAKHRTIPGGVPARKAASKVQKLLDAGYSVGTINAVCDVPLGVLRGLASGRIEQVTRDHEALLLAVTPQMCATVPQRAGSRGRTALVASQKVDASPTWELLTDLAARGFGIQWVGRELGYAGALQISHRQVQRRIADAVADLHRRVGDLTAPRNGRTQTVPPLADLRRLHAAVEVTH